MFSALRSSFVSNYSIVSFSRTLQPQSLITLRSRSSLTATAQDVLGTKEATTKQVDGRKVAAVCTLDFTDHSTAFRDKSIWELSRALIVLRLCSYTTFTENSYKIFQTMKNVFGLTITSALVRPLFYNQFVGGVTIPDIKKAVDRMRNAGSGTIILMVLEAIEQQNGAAANHQKITEKMEGLKGQIDNKTGENYMQIRLSALFSVPLLKELSHLKDEVREDFIHSAYRFMKTQNSEDMNSIQLSTLQLYAELKSALLLLEDIGQRALHTNTVLMIDAEYTYMNPALASLAMALALRCNKERPMVWNTTQCYLKKSFDAIKWEYDFLMNNHVCYGAKLVRGAYLVSETAAARSAGYPNPVHDSYDDTGHSYNEKVAWLLSKISEQKNKKSVRFVLATVNQDSINKAVERMNSLDIAADDNSMIFAQTYGMCDHVTYTLGQAGYPVHKSLAVGSVEEALAYLSRRSQENHSLIVNSGQERQLLKLELKQRVKNKMKMW